MPRLTTKMCKTHALKTSSDDDDTPLATKKKTVTDETTEKCIVNLKTGKNKGNCMWKMLYQALIHASLTLQILLLLKNLMTKRLFSSLTMTMRFNR